MSVFTLSSWVKKAFGLQDHSALATQGDSYSGQCVTASTALTLAAFWACVRLVSESTASLPLGVYGYTENGDKTPLRDNELYGILHDSPNADMTPVDFLQVMVASILLWGNSYSLKTYRGSGANKKLISLEPLLPSKMAFRLNRDGSITYIYSDMAGRTEYSEDRIMHIKGFGLSGRFGLSVIANARNSIGNALSLEESAGRLAANGLRAGGALTMPGTLKADQRELVRKNIADEIGGVAKSGGTIILEAGMKYEALSMPPEDAQLLGSRAFNVEEICRWFGVPPSLIGHTEKTTSWGTGLEQINLGFLTYTLQPILKRIEMQMRKSLLTAAERKQMFIEFNIEGFLRADSKGRAELYSSASQNGWMTRAEIRRKENLPFIPGSESLTVQSALTTLDKLGENTGDKQRGRLEDSAKL